MRAALRGAAETLITGSGLTALARRGARDSVAVLAYHNVVEPEFAGRGDASLHLPLDRFVAQVEWIAATHDVVPLDSVAFPRNGQARGRPRAVITFDDAYRGAVRYALPELQRRGLPATVFVSPGLLGADGTWWDLMGEAGMLNDDTRDAALHEFAGRREAVLQHAFGDAPAPHLPDSFGIATEAELRDRCGNGIVVGSHTWGHEFLPALPDDEFTSNLRETLRWLADFGASTSWLALPYGAGSLRQGEHALELGHTGVLRVRGGRWEDPCTRAAVPRINVPAGLSTRGLDIRTSGIR